MCAMKIFVQDRPEILSLLAFPYLSWLPGLTLKILDLYCGFFVVHLFFSLRILSFCHD